jgi:hypothetical protein
MRPTAQTTEGGEDGRGFVARAPWRFAKTMSHIPHEYTVRGQTTYTYLNIDGQRYWTMGAPLEATVIINRALLTVP